MIQPYAKNTMVLVLLALAAGCHPFWQRKELDYRTVVSDPNIDTEKAKAENTKALKCLDKGYPDKAEQALQKALIADVTYGPAHNNLGKLYYSQGKKYLAAWEFEYAIKLMPDCAEPYNNLGIVYETVGKYDEAVELYKSAVKIQPINPEMIGNLARTSIRRGDDFSVVKPLLNDLVLYDTRPDWSSWAKQQLIFSSVSTSDAPSSMEVIPTPDAVLQINPNKTPTQNTISKSPRLPVPTEDINMNKLANRPSEKVR